MPIINLPSSSSSMLRGNTAGGGGSFDPLIGEHTYTTPGQYYFTVPAGVTSLSAVVVGAGGSGGKGTNAAGGGALAYVNNKTYNPGTILTIVVGAGGTGPSGAGINSTPGEDGGSSYALGAHAGGGRGGQAGTPAYGTDGQFGGGGLGGVPSGVYTVGRTGGRGGGHSGVGDNAGGGSAAGYSSNGKNGASAYGSNAGSAGAGGSGGSGAGTKSVANGGTYVIGGSGGGVGIYGGGSNGAAGQANASTIADAHGTAGSGGSGVTHGAGTGSAYGGSYTLDGGDGAVRIIYGAGRAFPSTNTSAAISGSNITLNGTQIASSATGEHQFLNPGTFSWLCPTGVTKVSVVCIGGGGGGGGGYGPGGGGGGLAYKNDIPVTPGQTYTVVVGDAGTGAADDGDGSLWTLAQGSGGGASYFMSANTVRATGGAGATTTSASGSVGGQFTNGDNGGSGGLAAVSGAGYHWPGGGAGGYTGSGGRTGSSSSSYAGHSGTDFYGHDGAGGGGGGGGYKNSHTAGAGGGGTGIFGEGSNGAGGTNGPTGGGGGSGGDAGSAGVGNTGGIGGGPGGGGGCGYTTGGDGAVGAVRIVWGGRAFPSANVDLASSNSNVTQEPAAGPNWTTLSQTQQVVAGSPSLNAAFGQSLAFSEDGNYLLVGASGDRSGGTWTGRVWAYSRSGNTWSNNQNFVPPNITANDNFGWAIDITGNSTAVIGGRAETVGGVSDAGAAYIYTRSGTNWSRVADLTQSDPTFNVLYGGGVGISGQTAVVAAQQFAGGGKVYIWYNTSGNNWSLQTTLSGAASGDSFGNRVAIDGDTLAVSAPYADVSGVSNRGLIYIYTRSGTTWSLQQTINHGTINSSATDQGANGLVLKNNTLIFSSNKYVPSGSSNTNVGGVFVYTRSGTTWSHEATITPDLASDGYISMFGGDENTVAIGHHGYNSNQGRAWVYSRSGTSWSLQKSLTGSGTASGDYFGYPSHAVSSSGEQVAVVAGFDTISGQGSAGSVFIYTTS